MSTSTQSIEIAAPAEEVFAFVSDLERLPRWAIGFAKQIREHDGAWLRAASDEMDGLHAAAAVLRSHPRYLAPQALAGRVAELVRANPAEILGPDEGDR